MKPLIKHLFVFGFIANLISVVPSIAADEVLRNWMKETFEEAELGKTPTGWSVDKPELMTATIVENPDGGKALSINKLDVSDNGVVLSGPLIRNVPENGIVCVKASVMAMNEKALGSFVFQAPGGINNVTMNVGRSPALISENDTYIRLPVKFPPHQWVKLMFLVNLHSKTYDAYVDGEKVASDVGYADTRQGRRAFQICFGGISSSQGTFLLDDLEIVEADASGENQ